MRDIEQFLDKRLLGLLEDILVNFKERTLEILVNNIEDVSEDYKGTQKYQDRIRSMDEDQRDMFDFSIETIEQFSEVIRDSISDDYFGRIDQTIKETLTKLAITDEEPEPKKKKTKKVIY